MAATLKYVAGPGFTVKGAVVVWLSSCAVAVPNPTLVGVTVMLALPEASMASELEPLNAPTATVNPTLSP